MRTNNARSETFSKQAKIQRGLKKEAKFTKIQLGPY